MSALPNIILLPSPQSDFEQFWSKYPRRVARLAAVRAWSKAITIATPEEIMAGVELYKKHKPASQEWCHASTFLNGQRWQDDYGVEPTPQSKCWPSRKEVCEYARQKDDQNYWVAWYAYWAERDFRLKSGSLIDWKIVFSEMLSKHRSK